MEICLSVVIPVYNIEYKLNKCVESLLCQSFGDFELILVDDGSLDNSGRICDVFASADARIKVIHQANMGVTAARREGVEHSCGEWICFVDGDDILPVDALENLYKYTSGADIVVGQINWVTKDGKIIKKERIQPTELDHITYLKALLEGRTSCSPCGKVFRRCLFDSPILALPRSIVRGEDYIMCVRLAARAKRVRIIHECVYCYIQYTDSCSHRFINSLEYEKLFNDFLLRSLTDNHLQEVCRDSFIRSKIRSLSSVMSDLKLNSQDLFICETRDEAQTVVLTYKEKMILKMFSFPAFIRIFLYRIYKCAN